MKPIIITKDNYEAEIKNSKLPILLEFKANWCPTCRLFRPVMFQLARELDNVKVAEINVDEEKELAEIYGISTLPSILYIKNGKVICTRHGYVRKDELLELIQKEL